MKRIKKSPLRRVANARVRFPMKWDLIPYRFHKLDFNPSGVAIKLAAKPRRLGSTLYVLAAIAMTSGCSGLHPRVDSSGGELLLCVDTSIEDRCNKPEPKKAPVEDTDIQG